MLMCMYLLQPPPPKYDHSIDEKTIPLPQWRGEHYHVTMVTIKMLQHRADIQRSIQFQRKQIISTHYDMI